MSTGDLLRQNIDTLVVERRKAAKKCVEDTTKSPHVHTLGVAFVLDDLWSCVSNGAAWRHCLLVPHDLTETEIGDFDFADATASNAWDEFALIFFIFVELLRRGSFQRDDWYPLEQQVLGFDIPVNDSPFFVHVSNTVGNLEDNVTGEVLAKIRQLDDLMEQLSTLHH